LAAAFFYGQFRLVQSFDEGERVRVAVVQGGASPADESERPARLARYVELTRSAAAPQLIVWPEYAVEAYLQEASRTRDSVLRTAREAGADLVLGGPHYTLSPQGTRYRNSVHLVRDGRLAARYDKHRLVPFAETTYAPGSRRFVLPATALRLGALLCFESMQPDLAREAARQGADVLVNLSNDVWFGDAQAARLQLDSATLRAVENRRYLVRAASTGFSAVIDPHGRTLTRSDFDTYEVLESTVRASHARTPYQRWGDSLAWIVVAGVAAVSLRLFFKRADRPNSQEVS
jgi:apolipoprotein N-acyltransferase